MAMKLIYGIKVQIFLRFNELTKISKYWHRFQVKGKIDRNLCYGCAMRLRHT